MSLMLAPDVRFVRRERRGGLLPFSRRQTVSFRAGGTHQRLNQIGDVHAAVAPLSNKTRQ